MGKKLDITDEQLTTAIKAAHGMLTETAKALGISLDALRKRLKPDHIQLIADLREEVTDAAERHMFAGVRRGDPRAVEFWLKNQGKNRGYSERQEVKLEGQVSTEEASKRRQSIAGLLRKLAGQGTRNDGVAESVHPTDPAPGASQVPDGHGA